MLKATIETAVEFKAVRPAELERVIVDTTVQEKAIAHSVDSRLLEIARHKVATAAQRAGITLSCAAGDNIRWLMRAIARLAARRPSLARFGLALYGQISVIGAGSGVSGAVAALRQAVVRLFGFSAPSPTLAIQLG